eukprot:maker-scaffold284_size223161-snap-gene-1.19 protein:Tk12311 transcript:maker-scaffold284_size223161-snap-gene-1.19-mRNA-1 annotation:"hypothetical protein BRAFLDRAFT_215361"
MVQHISIALSIGGVLAVSTILGLLSIPQSSHLQGRMVVTEADRRVDPSSFSEPDKIKTTDIFLQLEADFQREVLHGSVTLSLEKLYPDVSSLVLDSYDLKIENATCASSGETLNFAIGQKTFLGSPLTIELPTKSDKKLKIIIHYETSPMAGALMWLNPAQTAGKNHPYVFSQCQAIHCRSMVPLQDTPAVKSDYSAEITTPKDLVALMSAIPQGESELIANDTKRKFRFVQKVPVQSYLIALAIGKLESRKIGPRSRVWSEKEFVDKAAYEFAETEEMLKTAEELNGPYVWGIYDILVLPPSFAYGGMENPCLTFATPTILAGDRSLASVITHEIAHSWTGNLVTNKNFEHFWLNEGFTVFAEQKIRGRMFGEAARHFKAIGGWKSLEYAIETLGEDNPLTKLVVDLSKVDPDDAFSTVPYIKGSTFLWYLEDLLGGPTKFEPFLRGYYDQFKYQSIDSQQFKAFLLEYFHDAKGQTDKIDWKAWFDKPGMPIYKPNFDDSMAKDCTQLKNKWIDWNDSTPSPFKAQDLEAFSSGQKAEFLAQLLTEKPLSVAKLEAMEKSYRLSSVHNSEIRFSWIRLGLLGHWEDAIPSAVQMVTEMGRMKFLRPIYRDMYAWEKARPIALKTFEDTKDLLMKVAVQGLAHDLKLD